MSNHNNYEVIIVLEQSIAPSALKSKISDLSQKISKITNIEIKPNMIDQCGLRGLVYEIKKNKRGHYIMFRISFAGEHVDKLKRELSFDNQIIRLGVIRVDEFKLNYLAVKKEDNQEEKVENEIDYKNIERLSTYTNVVGNILPQRITKLSSKDQRKVRKEIKRARNLALISRGV